MTYTQPPCKDCIGRYVGCHSGCLTWKQWKSKEDALKAEEAKRLAVIQGFQEITMKKRYAYIKRREQARGHVAW